MNHLEKNREDEKKTLYQQYERIVKSLKQKCGTQIEVEEGNGQYDIEYVRINTWKNRQTGQIDGSFATDISLDMIHDHSELSLDFISIHSEEFREEGITDEQEIEQKTLQLLNEQTETIKHSCELTVLKPFSDTILVISHDDDPEFVKTVYKKRKPKN